MTPSGLHRDDRIRARDLAINAAQLGLRNKQSVHYTQGPRRWDGINHDLKAYRGEYPHYADCSSYTTWCLWNGLDHFAIGDVVNGAHWAAGFTGTQLAHGVFVRPGAAIMRADLIIYNGHVAICLGGGRNTPGQRGRVISHGSEAGPFLVAADYRHDVMAVRRYI